MTSGRNIQKTAYFSFRVGSFFSTIRLSNQILNHEFWGSYKEWKKWTATAPSVHANWRTRAEVKATH